VRWGDYSISLRYPWHDHDRYQTTYRRPASGVCLSFPNSQSTGATQFVRRTSRFVCFRRAQLRCKWAATGTPKISLSVLTGSAIGAMACSTASTGVAFVSLIKIKTRATFPHADQLLMLGCWSTWCACVVFSKNKQRLKSLQTQGTPLAGGGERYDSNCFIYGALDITGYSWIMQVCPEF
jgi:hypothetical protein